MMSIEYMRRVFFAEEDAREEARRAVVAALEEPVAVVEETRDKQVLIRVSESQRAQWAEAAESDGLSVSEWLRQMADSRWREIFTCQHPLAERRVYPWAEFCLKCGVRLRG